MTLIAVAVRSGWTGQPEWQRRYDLDIYLRGAREFLQTGSPYGFVTERGLGFTYPPSALLPLLPLAKVPAGLDWWLMTALTLAVVGWLCQRWLPRGPSTTRWIAAITLLGMTEPFTNGIWLGQLSPVIGALGVLSIVSGGRVAAGLGGLAAAVKLTPLTVAGAFPFQAKAGQRLLALISSFAAVIVVGWFIAPTASSDYWSGLVWNTDRVGRIGTTSNVSLAGLLAHWGVPDQVSGRLGPLLAALAGAAMWLTWWAERRRTRTAPSAEALVVAVGGITLLGVPVSWSHHGLMISWAWAVLMLRGRTSTALVGGLVWTLPLLRWAGDTQSDLVRLALQSARPVSVMVLLAMVWRGALAHARVAHCPRA